MKNFVSGLCGVMKINLFQRNEMCVFDELSGLEILYLKPLT